MERVGPTNKVEPSIHTHNTRVRRRMGHINTTTVSTFFPEVQESDNTDELASQALSVFLGVGSLALVCVILSYTVIASTLREFDDWTRRKNLAEIELAEVTEFPRLEPDHGPESDETTHL